MSIIPGTVPPTVAGTLEYLTDKIHQADKHWSYWANMMSGAYATAYRMQGEVLRQVKNKQTERLKAEYEMMTFALSLFTVGIAGGVAGAVSRKFLDKGSFIAEKWNDGNKMETGIDAMKQVIQRVEGRQADKLLNALNPKVASGDVFEPSGVTPPEYAEQLKGGINLRLALLADLIVNIKYSRDTKNVQFDDTAVTLQGSGDKLTLGDARILTETILGSSFFQEAPPIGLDETKLLDRSQLALWMGWAFARNAKYWYGALPNSAGYYRDSGAFFEQFDWEPVRLDLGRLKVPLPPITASSLDGRTGLKVYGFLQWVDEHGMEALFDKDTPMSPAAFDMVSDEWSSKILTPHGWVDDTALSAVPPKPLPVSYPSSVKPAPSTPSGPTCPMPPGPFGQPNPLSPASTTCPIPPVKYWNTRT
jgi:hypothetical protein